MQHIRVDMPNMDAYMHRFKLVISRLIHKTKLKSSYFWQFPAEQKKTKGSNVTEENVSTSHQPSKPTTLNQV